MSFAYPGTDRAVFEKLQSHLSPGERIALIGENGEGKTTVVKLITRLYDPTEGQILLDGVDLREYSIEDLHRQIGVIFQDFMRFEMTARENIAVGRVDQGHQQKDLEIAAQKSLADTVVSKLAGGYDQMLGRALEGGVELSGGEWQKIALARAYLRDAQLLILDEPTAALDARSGLEVFERFAELTAGKMALLISHRFSTVRMAHGIVVLSGGRLLEEGDTSRVDGPAWALRQHVRDAGCKLQIRTCAHLTEQTDDHLIERHSTRERPTKSRKISWPRLQKTQSLQSPFCHRLLHVGV